MNIQIESVYYTYPGGVAALNGVSLVIHSGERVAWVGENGSGKTTLARHLNGLLRPQSGEVKIGDWITTRHTPAQLSRWVAYVFQNPDEQLFRQTIREEIAFGPQNLGCSASQVRSMVEDAILTTHLQEDVSQNPRDLGYSGRKKVALASALAMQAPILVLDEPTAGLDAGEQAQLSQVIGVLHGQGKTVLVISHDLDFVAENFDRVIRLHQGQVSQDLPARAFFEQDAQLTGESMANPQIARLSRSLGHAHIALTVEEWIAQHRKNLPGKAQ